jgi:hypothetical protein
MKGISAIIFDDMIDMAPALVAFFMLVLAFSTFTYNRLFDYLLWLVHLEIPVSSTYMYIAISIAILPLALLRIWNNSLLKAITYVSWALYLPSVLSFCGIDPFKILSFSMNFSLFSSKLPLIVITIAGIALACGSLTTRSFTYIKNARDNFVGRGADKKEAYRVLYRNAIFEMKIILASAAAVLLIMISVPAVEQEILGALKAAGFVYILAGLCAVVILALIFLVYLWPRKKGEKG